MEPLLRYGLNPSIASKVNVHETSCSFPTRTQPLLDSLLDGTVKLKSGSIIDGKDLESLLGGQPLDEDNYLTLNCQMSAKSTYRFYSV